MTDNMSIPSFSYHCRAWSILSLIIYLYSVCRSETFVNPSSDTTCGMAEDCIILCNALKSCSHRQFYVYNNSITITCSASKSCIWADIISYNVRSLTLLVSGNDAFSGGDLWTNSNDQNITVKCTGQNGCVGSRFHYNQKGIATHICDDTDTTTRQYGCSKATIHAMSAVSVHCYSKLYQKACKELKIIFPINKEQHELSSFILTGDLPMSHGVPVVIYSLYEPNIVCNDCSLDNVYIVYGIEFSEYCELSDTECINDIPFLPNDDDIMYINTYPGRRTPSYTTDLDFSGYSSDKNVIIILSDISVDITTFIPPNLSNDLSFISIMCIYCEGFDLDFYLVNNVALTIVRPDSGSATITGPQSNFVFNSFAECSSYEMFLNHSMDRIVINSAYSSVLYLGDNLHVDLNCGGIGFGCTLTQVHSSLDPLTHYPLQDIGWSINCPLSKIACTGSGCASLYDCEGFVIWFPGDTVCGYSNNNDPGCGFLTKAPTSAPTIAPTLAPTKAPTVPPTLAPSVAPTLAPSAAPTTPPTAAPTLTPTAVTLSPSFSPSKAPSNAPSQPPSVAPTQPPTINPSQAPSFSPTTTTTNAPTNAPTTTPSIDPTTSPTISPSLAPSIAPTLAPSHAPSNAPSNAPTRFPTVFDAYSHVLYIEYVMHNVTNKHILNAIRNDQENIIERIELLLEYVFNYVSAEFSDLFQDSTEFIEYKEFEIIVDGIWIQDNNVSVNILTSNHFEDSSVGTKIEFISSKATFKQQFKAQFSHEFDTKHMEFAVVSVSRPSEEDDSAKSFDYVLYSLLSFMLIMCIGSIAVVIHNKLPNSRIDDADAAILMIFGLQIFDFVSDINLAIEMVTKFNGKLFELSLLYIAAYICIIFVIIPYITNIIMTVNIKNIVSTNPAAVSYFEQKAPIFVTLVVFSGSVYPVLCLLSSRLFCLEILNCGLTRYETRNLIKMKVFSNVILENIPQLVAQVFYIYYLGGVPSENTVLSFAASFLSVIAVVLSYFIHCQSSECYVVQYDLKMSISHSTLSGDDKSKISRRKERKKALRNALCSCIGIRHTEIELGYVTVTSNGIVIHLIHYFLKNKIETVHAAEIAIHKLYSNKYNEKQINMAFQTHFGFSNAFKVRYIKQYDNLKQKTVSLTNVQRRGVEDYNGNDSCNVIESLVLQIGALLRANETGNDIFAKLSDDGHDKDKVMVALSLFGVRMNGMEQDRTKTLEIQETNQMDRDDSIHNMDEGNMEEDKTTFGTMIEMMRNKSSTKYTTLSECDRNDELDDLGELQALKSDGQTSTAL